MKIATALHALIFCALLALPACDEAANAAQAAADEHTRTQLIAELTELAQRLPTHDLRFFVSQRRQQSMRRLQPFTLLPQKNDTTPIDTMQWLNTLRLQYQLPAQPYQLAYTRTPLQGSYEDSLHIVELYAAESSQNRQFVWDKQGRLVHESQADYFAFLPLDSAAAPYLLISSEQAPFLRLLAYSATSSVLIDKLDTNADNLPPLRSHDTTQYTGGTLTPKGEDVNADGYADLVFTGTTQGKKPQPRRYVFQFRRAKDAFFWVGE